MKVNSAATSSEKKPVVTSAAIIHERVKLMLDNLEAHSINFELPELPKNMKFSQQYFNVLESILFEWKHTDNSSTATNEEV